MTLLHTHIQPLVHVRQGPDTEGKVGGGGHGAGGGGLILLRRPKCSPTADLN